MTLELSDTLQAIQIWHRIIYLPCYEYAPTPWVRCCIWQGILLIVDLVLEIWLSYHLVTSRVLCSPVLRSRQCVMGAECLEYLTRAEPPVMVSSEKEWNRRTQVELALNQHSLRTFSRCPLPRVYCVSFMYRAPGFGGNCGTLRLPAATNHTSLQSCATNQHCVSIDVRGRIIMQVR